MKYIPIPIDKYTNFRYDNETYKKYKMLYDIFPAEIVEKILSFLDNDLKDISYLNEEFLDSRDYKSILQSNTFSEEIPIKINKTKYGYFQEGNYDYDSDFFLYASDTENSKESDIFECEI